MLLQLRRSGAISANLDGTIMIQRGGFLFRDVSTDFASLSDRARLKSISASADDLKRVLSVLVSHVHIEDADVFSRLFRA